MSEKTSPSSTAAPIFDKADFERLADIEAAKLDRRRAEHQVGLPRTGGFGELMDLADVDALTGDPFGTKAKVKSLTE